MQTPITLTPRAIEMGKKKLAQWGGDGAIGIRVGVKGGGCSGLSYVFDFAEKLREGKDFTMEFDGLTVVCDHKSVELLRGSVLDWSDDLVNHGFRWKNPNAKGDCGCGESFSV
jgi:iron-sulfur cluster assembly protein